MNHPRIIVAQAPSPAAPSGRMAVGVVRWTDPVPTLSLVVKLTFSFGQDARVEGDLVHLVPAVAPEPLSRNQMMKGVDGAEVLAYPSDFVPVKDRADVLLRGHGYGAVSEGDPPTSRIMASITMGLLSRSFHLVAAGLADRLPLAAPYLRDTAGAETAPVGPVATPEILAPPAFHTPSFDFSVYNAATPAQRLDDVEPGMKIRIRGLSPRAAERTLVLPSLLPRAFMEYGNRDDYLETYLYGDTLLLDTDRELAIVVYRGTLEMKDLSAREIRRIVIGLDDTTRLRTLGEMLRELPRGEFFYALTAADLEPGAPPVPDKSVELKLARYQSLGYVEPPTPQLSLEQYSAVVAELSEGREPRAAALKKHGVDPDHWIPEERGWGQRIAGDRAIAVRYGALFIAAQDALAEPREAERGVADYEALRAAAAARPLHEVLAEAKMSTPAWLRLKRRCNAELRARGAAAETRALEGRRARLPLPGAPTPKALPAAASDPRERQET